MAAGLPHRKREGESIKKWKIKANGNLQTPWKLEVVLAVQ
ncbi:hypothetical protein NMG60_11015935 [Bertholletia excelsa]